MLYGIIAIIIASFGSGFYTAHSIDNAEIFALKTAIEKANEQGRSAMQEATRIVNEAQKEAIENNNELDKANESSINTINAYYDRVQSIHKARRSNAMPKSYNTGEPSKDAGNTYDILAELHRADLAAIEKNTLLKFIKWNCGIHVRD
jgi:vacuolar-type H+-ATPase subunit H